LKVSTGGEKEARRINAADGARKNERTREHGGNKGGRTAKVDERGGRGIGVEKIERGERARGDTRRETSALMAMGREAGRKEEGKDERRPIGPCGRRKRCE